MQSHALAFVKWIFAQNISTLTKGSRPGWILDKRSAAVALVLAVSLCGLGCLLRAMARGPDDVLVAAAVMSVDGSFESLVLAYACRDLSPEKR
eukprot:SAG31_NODE_170_length_21415_cov_8.230813_6_plen_93_part_00